MTALLLNLTSAGMQYICSVALILICVLVGSHLYLMRTRKTDKPHETAKPSEEPTEEQAEETADSEEQPVALPVPGNTFVRGIYNKSFTAKLIQAPDPIKQFYVDLANELLAYHKVRNRISWANSSFSIGRQAVSKFAIRGKTLYMYLALNPNDFQDSKYFITDESAAGRYAAVPLRMKVKSKRGVKFGKELIEILMRQLGAARSEGEPGCIQLTDYPYETTENLLERGLIKLKTDGKQPIEEAGSPVAEDFERREQVSVTEAQTLLSDEVAVSLIEETEEAGEVVLSKPKGIINIDTLSENYQANETVTLESLKEKKLIGASVNHVKVLARGILNKPLIVKMPEFSVDAVKMILLTGGKAIRLKTEKQ